jgi:peroxiredoxin
VVLGITFSPSEDLKNWAVEVGLESHLLCDSDRSVAMAYGAAESADQEKATRISIHVGPDGVVRKTYESFDAAAHANDALADFS